MFCDAPLVMYQVIAQYEQLAAKIVTVKVTIVDENTAYSAVIFLIGR